VQARRTGEGLNRGIAEEDRDGIVGELFSFFWSNKRWWLVPMLVALFLIGTLIVLAESSAIAPFIYTLF
jgi:hypothetical protein